MGKPQWGAHQGIHLADLFDHAGPSAPAFGVFATHASETMPQIAAIDEGISYLPDYRPPKPMGWGETLVIEALEAVEIVLDQAE